MPAAAMFRVVPLAHHTHPGVCIQHTVAAQALRNTCLPSGLLDEITHGRKCTNLSNYYTNVKKQTNVINGCKNTKLSN